jgi:hypothetical protein
VLRGSRTSTRLRSLAGISLSTHARTSSCASRISIFVRTTAAGFLRATSKYNRSVSARLRPFGPAFVDVQVVDDHHNQPVRPCGLIVPHVQASRSRQQWGRRDFPRALVRHLFEGGDDLSSLAIENGEVGGFQAANVFSVLVDDHDVDLNELDAGAEGGLLRRLCRQGRAAENDDGAERFRRIDSTPHLVCHAHELVAMLAKLTKFAKDIPWPSARSVVG